MIKLLIGGSPCTYWSIAKRSGREVVAEGFGWELFKNYDKMGFTNVKYYAYEIDKYAMQIANKNYPDIIQCGDVFQVRDDAWRLEGVTYEL